MKVCLVPDAGIMCTSVVPAASERVRPKLGDHLIFELASETE